MPDDFTPTDWITTTEAAELTGYAPVHIRHLVRDGQIQGKKFGHVWMVDRNTLLAYAEKMKQLGEAKHDPWRAGARQRKTEN